ncbi:hypothetical protein ACWGTI_30435 [Mesorhizobium sp. ArgA1]
MHQRRTAEAVYQDIASPTSFRRHSPSAHFADNDNLVCPEPVVSERRRSYCFAVLDFLPMAGRRAGNVVGIASLRDVLIANPKFPGDLRHRLGPDQIIELTPA